MQRAADACLSLPASPIALEPQGCRIFLAEIKLLGDAERQDFAIGRPHKLLANINMWLDAACLASTDAAGIWDHDVRRHLVRSLADERRFNLQEMLCRAMLDGIVS